MLNKSLFTSNKQDWETPDRLFSLLNQEFDFDVDVCANIRNSKCSIAYSEDWDSLRDSNDWSLFQEGETFCFMNPPYGEIEKWVKKAYEQSFSGCTTVCLIPSRTDTQYFHEYCSKAAEIRFIKGRLKFSNSQNSAPFPSCIVIFRAFKEEAWKEKQKIVWWDPKIR